jgi:hypothetical protein
MPHHSHHHHHHKPATGYGDLSVADLDDLQVVVVDERERVWVWTGRRALKAVAATVSFALYCAGFVVLCCVVWCGVVWCGVVWCGVVWCCVVLRCAVLCVR